MLHRENDEDTRLCAPNFHLVCLFGGLFALIVFNCGLKTLLYKLSLESLFRSVVAYSMTGLDVEFKCEFSQTGIDFHETGNVCCS